MKTGPTGPVATALSYLKFVGICRRASGTISKLACYSSSEAKSSCDITAFSLLPDPCALVDCVPGYRCIVSDITGQGICDPSCDLNNGECPANQICRISEIDCGNQPCDNYRVISCEYPVPGWFMCLLFISILFLRGWAKKC